MSTVTIWHNPRCSKSRQTLALLEENGIQPDVRVYLTDGPSLAELQAVQQALGLPAAAFCRVNDKEFAEAGLSKTDDDATLLAAMAATPRLIERPIVIANGKAALGRPPEAVLDIL
ncbi:arsenate reductase (glutaredoxin) [Actibacterium sp. XHP0104]|uniref:arsenate reductase (glutaredoxin) n=1 Tax=Actibacterium sp. XHP0104 TaxID=2984335 RepID=UPI0021E83358|nr:arsenate reductase (glutaredoxin) [Actibacterium sp. XHP0104]MCV2880538.1 arsenate reductase (glutaredoxin) [Actibacterium sp. XHP0104]